ncbi:MAG: hypothetical protein H6563_08395 [Lewinellaceae bacterium]|nr:hypothetical protein [Lewinellaceae bacterium]
MPVDSKYSTIDKNRDLAHSQDYYFLRQQGIAFIRELSGNIWTDHNVHDPGITMLELLCYALADLGYRTGFDIRDLVAKGEQEDPALQNTGLFPAHEILPTCPLTLADYRKILLKVEGVRNAWLHPLDGVSEVPFFADCPNSQLTFAPLTYEIVDGPWAGHTVILDLEKRKETFKYARWITQIDLEAFQVEAVAGEWRWTTPAIFTTRIRGREKKISDILVIRTADDFQNALPGEVSDLLKNEKSALWKDFWDKQEKILKEDLHRVIPRGLYDVLLELDIDEQLGSLNEQELFYRIPFGALKGVEVAFDLKDPFDVSLDFTEILELNEADIILVPGDPKKPVWKVRLKVKLDDQEVVFDNAFIRIINAKPNSLMEPVDITAAFLKEALEGTTADNRNQALFSVFWKKQQTIDRVISAVCCVLHAHRNLCEDFHAIQTIEAEHIAVCVDIETRNDADLEVLQAKIFLAIEEYLNPPVKYYTLSELLKEGFTADEIFDGPYVDPEFSCQGKKVFTKSGFIKNGELEETELRQAIYASDLINILLEFDEIITVRNLLLRRYNASGQADAKAEPWSLPVTPGKQPVLNTAYSKLLFYKNQIPYTAKRTETRETLDYLRALNRKKAYVPPNQVIEPPQGRYRDLHQYFPVQHDLPETYGVGEARLPLDAPPARIAQAKQLKAYLLFYEQVLADYLAQLTNAKWLLSPEDIKQTYFSQYLDGEIIARTEGDFEEEFYVSQNGVPPLRENSSRQKLYESKEQFIERRNRLLDHLLARFGEQFTDYTLMLFNLTGDRIKAGEDLINDKIDFLGAYPLMSRTRGQAFNYRPEDPAQLWNSGNISGLERRVGRLAGIQDLSRRFLHCSTPVDKILKSQKVANEEKYFITIKSQNGNKLFASSETYASRGEADAVVGIIAPYLRSPGIYRVEDDGSLIIELPGIQLTHEDVLGSINEGQERIRDIFRAYDFFLLSKDHCGAEDREGIMLIEHILLRPLFQSSDQALLDICLSGDCQCCGDEDPYSFRISVVLPYWTGRFNNMNFRRFFERLLREETPAHIQPRICWIDNQQMKLLGERFKAFLEEKTKKEPEPAAYNQALVSLVVILDQLNTIYPEATLHDCEEDAGEIPVRLGATSLGSY